MANDSTFHFPFQSASASPPGPRPAPGHRDHPGPAPLPGDAAPVETPTRAHSAVDWTASQPDVPVPSSAWPGLPPDPPMAPPTAPPVPPSNSAQGVAAVPSGPAPSAPSAKRRARRRLAAGLAAAGLVVSGGIVGGAVGARLGGSTTSGGSSVTAQTVAKQAVTNRTVADHTASSGGGFQIDAGAVLAKMTNSVVAIQTKVTTYDGPWSSQGEAAGTGIVVDNSGDILTNAHVVAGAQSITVTLPGSTAPRTATLVGSDPAKDVAVIHVDDTTGLEAATLASTSAAEVGEGVVAIGNALALQGSLTVTQGIVSAVDRSIQTDESSSLTGLLQTDAAISSGNSGGPLVNASGTVIAMNTAVASSNGQVQASNVGFAIPIHTALDEAEEWLHRA